MVSNINHLVFLPVFIKLRSDLFVRSNDCLGCAFLLLPSPCFLDLFGLANFGSNVVAIHFTQHNRRIYFDFGCFKSNSLGGVDV
jgi:hypothetical protein